MASSLNTVALIGNLVRDPELRQAGSTSVCALRIAVNDRRKNNATGEWEDKPGFFDVTVFAGQGENCAKFLSKGSRIGVSGKLDYREWEKDGQKRSAVQIIANDVVFLTPKSEQATPTPDTEPEF